MTALLIGHRLYYRGVMENPPANTAELAAMIAALPELPDLVRARRARALVDEAKRVLSATADAAVESATRRVSYAEVAKDLGVGVPSVNKAVSRHRRRTAGDPPE